MANHPNLHDNYKGPALRMVRAGAKRLQSGMVTIPLSIEAWNEIASSVVKLTGIWYLLP